MKKLLLFAIAFCLIAGASYGQIMFGPKAGVSLSKYSLNYDEPDGERNLTFRVGPSIGAVMDLQLCDFVSFQPSALFTIKGAAENLSKGRPAHPNHEYDGYNRDRIFYFEVPVNFAGKLELGPGTAQIFVGPYFALAIAGRSYYDYTETRMDGSEDTYKGDEKIKFRGTVSEDDMDIEGVGKFMKPLDFGFDFGIGYQWKALLFNIGYQMGIANLTPDYEGVDFDPADFKMKNSSIFFNVAWLFGAE